MSSALLDRTQIAQGMQTATTGSGDIKLDTPVLTTVRVLGPNGWLLEGKVAKLPLVGMTLAQATTAAREEGRRAGSALGVTHQWPVRITTKEGQKIYEQSRVVSETDTVDVEDP